MFARRGCGWLVAVCTGAASLAAAGQAFAATHHVYIAAQRADVADEYFASSTGALTSFGTAVTGSGPSLMAVGVSGSLPKVTSAYVTNIANGTVSQYTVTSSGALVAKSPAAVATGSSPVGIALSSTSAYVTNFGSNTVSQYTIGAGGKLTPKSPATVATEFEPEGIAVSPNGKSVYVANAASGTVSQYTVGSGGKLVPKVPATVARGSGESLVVVSPKGTSVYVTNLADNTVSQYTVSSGGKLVPKLPATVATGTEPLGIAIGTSKMGLTTVTSVYVTNSIDNTVSQYTMGAGGKLVAKSPATVATGSQPFYVATSAATHSAYVTNFSGSSVSEYTEAGNGALTSFGTVPTDSKPWGIAVH